MNLLIVVGGLCVKAGDVVIGDIDGVVVVPYDCGQSESRPRSSGLGQRALFKREG